MPLDEIALLPMINRSCEEKIGPLLYSCSFNSFNSRFAAVGYAVGEGLIEAKSQLGAFV